MPVVEKYGLMVLFALCALIVGVGIFAEDPLTKVALVEKQEAVEPSADEVDAQEGDDYGTMDDSDWAVARPERPRGDGLMSYSPPSQYDGRGPDPMRESSLGDLPKDLDDISENGVEPKNSPKRVAPKKEGKLETRSYVVKKGDSIGKIASKQLGSTRYADDIRRANPKIKNDLIYAGKTIQLPVIRASKKSKIASKTSKTRYIRVKKGETLMAIAKREYGDKNKWKELARRNGIKKDKDLRDSQKLLIPSDL